MEQHGWELYDKNKSEEKHEDETDRFQLEVLLWNQNLKPKTEVWAKSYWNGPKYLIVN